MKRAEEATSLFGMLAYLGMAAAIAYLAAENDRPGAKHAVASEADVAPARAMASSGRGRHATSPSHIPVSGWKDILWRTYEQINDDRLLAVAAGVVFYGLLALFPAITALVSCYALVVEPQAINEHLAFCRVFYLKDRFRSSRTRSAVSFQKVMCNSAALSFSVFCSLSGAQMAA